MAIPDPQQNPSSGLLWKVAGAVALAVLTAVLTYAFTARLNVETARQQQQATAIQQFEESGAQMDSRLSLFIDALLDGREVAQAKTDARTAITLHAAQANSLASLVGTGNVNQYTNGLGDLRQLADGVNGPITGRRMAQKHVILMDYRVKLVALARKRVYE